MRLTDSEYPYQREEYREEAGDCHERHVEDDSLASEVCERMFVVALLIVKKDHTLVAINNLRIQIPFWIRACFLQIVNEIGENVRIDEMLAVYKLLSVTLSRVIVRMAIRQAGAKVRGSTSLISSNPQQSEAK